MNDRGLLIYRCNKNTRTMTSRLFMFLRVCFVESITYITVFQPGAGRFLPQIKFLSVLGD